MLNIACALLTAYIVILFGRMLISWLPPSSGAMANVARVLFDLTEPVLGPMRRIIPPIGMFDISFTILVIGLLFVRSAVCR